MGDPGAAVTLTTVSYRIDTTPSSTPAATVLDAAATGPLLVGDSLVEALGGQVHNREIVHAV